MNHLINTIADVCNKKIEPTPNTIITNNDSAQNIDNTLLGNTETKTDSSNIETKIKKNLP